MRTPRNDLTRIFHEAEERKKTSQPQTKFQSLKAEDFDIERQFRMCVQR